MSVISDTGPLISIFQSGSLAVVRRLANQIFITPVCVTELQKHGYGEALIAAGEAIVIRTLIESEGRHAFMFAQQIASDLFSKDPEPRNHLGEAEVIALALRPEFITKPVLIDERAARAVAKRAGLQVTGFAGILLSSVDAGLLTALEVRQRLDLCRQLGTHYGERFIEGIYESARTRERKS